MERGVYSSVNVVVGLLISACICLNSRGKVKNQKIKEIDENWKASKCFSSVHLLFELIFSVPSDKIF